MELHEQVVSIEEVGASHRGAIFLAEVVHSVLEEYDLTQTVSNFFYLFVL